MFWVVLRFALLYVAAFVLSGVASEDVPIVPWVDPCEGLPTTLTAAPDHAVFAEVLAAHVSRGTVSGVEASLVDYASLVKDPSKLREYLVQLCHVDLSSLQPKEALALLANAYNALMLSVVVRHRPPRSVRDIPDVWSAKIGTVGGRSVSLDDVEHDLIRGEKPPDPNGALSKRGGLQGRMHAGLVCASLSCPDLLSKPFLAETLDAQLTDATQKWLANPTKNRRTGDANDLQLSKIFDWYARDFIAAKGTVLSFVRTYHKPWAGMPDDTVISFIEYNWNLNAVPGKGPTNSTSSPARATSVGCGSPFVIIASISLLVLF